MLVITRLTAELRDGNVDRAERLAKGIQALAVYIIENKTKLAERDYQNANEKGEEHTLAEFWDVYAAHGLFEPVSPERLKR